MTDTQKNGGESVIRLKKIVQMGVNTIVGGEPQSVLSNKVLCTRVLLVDINKCFHCPHNKGLLNQYLVQCGNEGNNPLPKELEMDIDYPEVKVDAKK